MLKYNFHYVSQRYDFENTNGFVSTEFLSLSLSLLFSLLTPYISLFHSIFSLVLVSCIVFALSLYVFFSPC